MVKGYWSPFCIKERFQSLCIFLDEPLSLIWKLVSRSFEVIHRYWRQCRRGCQPQQPVSPYEQSGLTKCVLALEMHGCLDNGSPVEHPTPLDLAV